MPDTSRATSWTDDLRLAHLLADNADSLSMDRFKAQDLRVSAKPDRSAVTDADVTIEESLRRTLQRARPRDVIVGEEGGTTGEATADGARRWVIDPVDGTSNFVRGVPVWATLIGLMDGDECVVGVVSAPALGRRWWGSVGGGAYTGRSIAYASPIAVSQVSDVADASMSYSSMGGWVDAGLGQNFVDLMRSCWRTRAYGDFWSYMLLAEGAVDIACEPELALHDMAALVPIVTEAGGIFTNIDGRPGPFGPGALATNGPLHDGVLVALAAEGADAADHQDAEAAVRPPRPGATRV